MLDERGLIFGVFNVTESPRTQRTELWQDLDRRVFFLTQLINTTKERLKETEHSLLVNVTSVTSSCYNAVNEIQRVVQALEDRINQINGLIASDREIDIAKATVISGSDLVFKNDAMHKLISDESLAPLAFENLSAHLDGLFKAASVRKQRTSTGLF